MRCLAGLSLLALMLAACQPPPRDTMTICKGADCAVVPSDTVTFDPGAAIPDPDPDGRLAGLVALAEQDPRAAYDLGLRFMRGDGLRQNSYEGIKWMRNAAERGDHKAQSALGRLYLTGLEEMGADYNEAQRWLRLAAAKGDVEAAKLLKEAEARRADEQAYQDYARRWRYRTHYYWYGTPYYWAWNGHAWYYPY